MYITGAGGGLRQYADLELIVKEKCDTKKRMLPWVRRILFLRE